MIVSNKYIFSRLNGESLMSIISDLRAIAPKESQAAPEPEPTSERQSSESTGIVINVPHKFVHQHFFISKKLTEIFSEPEDETKSRTVEVQTSMLCDTPAKKAKPKMCDANTSCLNVG